MSSHQDLRSPRAFVRCPACDKLRPANTECCKPVLAEKIDPKASIYLRRVREEQAVVNGAAASPQKPDTVHESAVALGRLGGIKGGPARARILTAAQKHVIAQHAAAARWKPVRVEVDEELAIANYEKEWGETRDCPNDLVAEHWARLSSGEWIGYCQRCGRWIGQQGNGLRLIKHIVWSAWQEELWAQAEAGSPDERTADANLERLIEQAWPDEPYWSRPVVDGDHQ